MFLQRLKPKNLSFSTENIIAEYPPLMGEYSTTLIFLLLIIFFKELLFFLTKRATATKIAKKLKTVIIVYGFKIVSFITYLVFMVSKNNAND